MNVQSLYLNHKTSKEFINLLPRDWELLSFLEQQGFATFKQIQLRFFNNRQNCSLRLIKLIKYGYISESPVIDLFLTKNEQTEGKLFPFISEIELNPRMSIYFLSKEFRSKYSFSEGLLKKQLIVHQLLLNDLRVQLEKEIAHQLILNDSKIRVVAKIESGRHETIRPDLSFEFGKFKVAIELERTIKNKSRYFERFLYYQDSVYSHVIYYTTDRKKIEFLIDQVSPYKKIAVGYSRVPNELYHNIYGLLNLKTFFYKISEGEYSEYKK